VVPGNTTLFSLRPIPYETTQDPTGSGIQVTSDKLQATSNTEFILQGVSKVGMQVQVLDAKRTAEHISSVQILHTLRTKTRVNSRGEL
jgi:hypothetical protein